MKIVLVQSGLSAGGTEKVVNLLARHRSNVGDEVHVLTFSGSQESSYFKYEDDITISSMNESRDNAGSRILRVIARVQWLRKKFQSVQPDVIVSFLTKVNVLTLISSRDLGIPVVISERNNPGRQNAARIWKKGIEWLAPFAAQLVMQTHEAKMMMGRKLQQNVSIIPNPAIKSNTVKRVSGDGISIVAVGRLTRQKGFDLLLKAYARIAAEWPSATLTIFGEGPEHDSLIAQAHTLGIGTRVTFPGLTETPGAWLTHADIFVLSSRFEGFPNVLVEALASGVATIAFKCPWGPSEILSNGKDGLLVEPEDVSALASAIRQLLSDPDLRKKFSMAGPQAAQRFNLANVLEQWDSVIDQVAKENVERATPIT